MSREPDGVAAPMRLLPGLRRLLGYQRAWLVPDVVAGLTVGAMLIPQGMAYAELGGLAPEHGFYAAIGALVVYALVGSSRHLGVGPEPGTAILAGTGVAAMAGHDPTRYVALMAALALVVAAICLVAAAARLGFLASLLSKPVLVGYITGVGLTLLSSQIAGFTGAPITEDRLVPRFAELASDLSAVQGTTLALAAATLLLIQVLRHRAPGLPAALIGVVVATVVAVAWSLDGHGVALVGSIPSGLPAPALPDVSLHDLTRLLALGAGIALVGYTDNVLTARAIAAENGYRIDTNQELFALGMTNLVSGLSGGFPVSSSASRTAVPSSLRSQTQLVSLVASAFVVASVLGLRGVLGEIPRAALAAVIVSAALSIIDVAGYRALWRLSRKEFLLGVVTAAAVVSFDILTGVLVAVTLSVLLALYRVARPHDAVLGDRPELDGWVDLDDDPSAHTEPGLLVYRFDAPLFFGNADHFRDRVGRVLEENPGDEAWLVLDFEGIGAVDVTAMEALDDLVHESIGRGVEVVAVARANHEVLDHLGRAGLLEPPGALRTFPTINSAVHAFRTRPRGSGGTAYRLE